MSEWQPIETAPVGGGLFLIYVPSASRTPIKMGRRTANVPPWFGETGATVWDDRGNGQRASHWMPLPEAPR